MIKIYTSTMTYENYGVRKMDGHGLALCMSDFSFIKLIF